MQRLLTTTLLLALSLTTLAQEKPAKPEPKKIPTIEQIKARARGNIIPTHPTQFADHFTLTLSYHAAETPHFLIVLQNTSGKQLSTALRISRFEGVLRATAKDGTPIQLYQLPYLANTLTGTLTQPHHVFRVDQKISWTIPVDTLVYLSGHKIGQKWRHAQPEELHGLTFTADLQHLSITRPPSDHELPLRTIYSPTQSNAALLSNTITIPKP